MIQALLLIAFAFAFVALARRFLRMRNRQSRDLVKGALIWGVAIFVLLLLATGRLGILIPLLGAVVAALVRMVPVLLALALQYLPLWMRWRQRQAGESDYVADGDGRTSTVASRFLRMKLDHATGEVEGEVVQGPYAGYRLNDLSIEQLSALHSEWSTLDPESAALLRAYLERVYGSEWAQAKSGPDQRHSQARMSVSEAREVLGLAAGASRAEIVSAHRRLIQRLHPDRGGSDYLAAKINQAKSVLLAGAK